MKNSSRTIRRTGISGILAMIAIAIVASPASAAPGGIYRYHGPTSGFDSEKHMLVSLRVMKRASNASHERSHDLIAWAIQEVRDARHEAVSHRAEDLLRNAKRHLKHYQNNDDIAELEEAAILVKRSLRAEARTLVGRGHNHAPQIQVPWYGPNNKGWKKRGPKAPKSGIGNAVMVYPAGLSVGGKWGKVRIRF